MGIDWYKRGEPHEESPGPWRWEDWGGDAACLVDANGGRVLEAGDVGATHQRDAELIADARTMLQILRVLEWRARATGGVFVCNYCGAERVHAADCRVAALLEAHDATR